MGVNSNGGVDLELQEVEAGEGDARRLLPFPASSSAATACVTWFSEQARAGGLGGPRRAEAAAHTPCPQPGSAEALEVGVLAVAGRAPSPRRRAALCAASAVALGACAVAGWACASPLTHSRCSAHGARRQTRRTRSSR